MSSTSHTHEPGFVERLRKARRKRVMRFGKWLTRSLSRFFARQSLVADRPVLDNADFPFLYAFVDHWQEIRAEVAEILKHRDAIPKFLDVSPDQKKISRGNDWRTFILYGFGTKMVKNCCQAPVTTRILEQVPDLQTAWFSILSPRSHIPAHCGVTKGIVRSHLGLIIPREAEKCRIRVDGEICVWRPGEIFVFDDTFEHEVWNDTDEERVILLFDFDRPMRWPGRVVSAAFIRLMKFTAYYRDPKKNMATYEERFEAATRRADEMLEKLSKLND